MHHVAAGAAPNLLEFTVTGQPGEEILVGAESGSSFIGSFPDGFSATCWAGGAEIVTLPIVEADEGPWVPRGEGRGRNR
jgi:hypothetical protein